MLASVVALVGYALAVVFASMTLSEALVAWLVAAYVAGGAYQATFVFVPRVEPVQLLRAGVVVDTFLVAGLTSMVGTPELANALYLCPLLVATALLEPRDVWIVASIAVFCSIGVPLRVNSPSWDLLLWSGPVGIAVVGGALACIAAQARQTERRLERELCVEDVALRFTERAREGADLEHALRGLEQDVRVTLGASVAWVDLAGDKRTRRTLPSGAVVPVVWNGGEVARFTVGRGGGRAVPDDLVRQLERLASFVGAVVGQVNAVEHHTAANDRLRAAELLKDKFLAMASHELRTPLTSIRGFSETLARQWESLADEDRRRFLSIVVSQSQRLAHLVEDVMLLSGIQSGRFRMHPVPVPVADVVERSVRAIGSNDVVLDCDPDVFAFADPDHLEQMLANYLTNAMQYGAEPITVTCGERSGEVTIAVEDVGTGISDEFKPRLFGEFQRDRGSVGVHGAGLGLSIVRTLARAYDGDAWYEPNSPRGARFLVRLPAYQG